MEQIVLYKPVEFEGETIKEFPMDLDGLTAADMLTVERQFDMAAPGNESTFSKELSKEYQLITAARAANKPVELFYKLSARDFTRITLKVQLFFAEAESVPATGQAQEG
ncbi:phage tail assembly protein [Paenibacillus azoreducens]|uniref:phage tail assembly protein n=1 Tax=Paenibacillus azoreducens TaxID=116718 RepID=UPI0039F62FF5